MYSRNSAGLRWRKSSHSGGNQTNCVEVAWPGERVAVRDSQDPEGPILTFDRAVFAAFLNHTTGSAHS